MEKESGIKSMSYYNYEDYYDEPSEFEQQIEELFETISKDLGYAMYFKNEEDCQIYCNWLNDKNGITRDMTISGRHYATRHYQVN